MMMLRVPYDDATQTYDMVGETSDFLGKRPVHILYNNHDIETVQGTLNRISLFAVYV